MTRPTTRVLSGKAVLDKALDLWLDGFTTGAASAVRTLAPTRPAGEVDQFADDMRLSLESDPLAMAVVVQEITERLTDAPDTGPKEFTVKATP